MNPLAAFQQGLSTRYDNGVAFRRQEPRSLEDIDELIQRMQQMRLHIGLERAAHIEQQPELFADGEKFRIWHAKARMNCIIFTALSYVGGIGALNMFMPHLKASQMVKQYRPLVLLGCAGYAAVTYQIFSRLAGFDATMWSEYNYAKMIRQMRNVQIKQ